MIELAGRLHPLLLHLPIGVLLYAFLHWVYNYFFDKKNDLTFALSLGAVGAIASAVSGWLLAREGGFDEDLLRWHQYLGIGTAVSSVLLLWAYRKWSNQTRFGLLFLTVTLLLGATGHYGGSLTHGEGFLAVSERQVKTALPRNIREAHLFNDLVMPIVSRKCVSCHNPQKSKGELLLHNLAGWLAGGKNGAILKPGSISDSPIIGRVQLPKEDEQHMPPAGKLQLTNDELEFLTWWIASMENYDHLLKDLETNPKVEQYLADLKSRQQPQPEKPSGSQLAKLKHYGIIAALQSREDSWVSVRPQTPDSFDTANLKHLGKIAPAIRSMDLSNTSLQDGDLSIFSRLENISTINLSNCDINSNSLSELRGLPYLRSLNLYGTNVDSTVFSFLEELPNLEKVYLWNTPAGADGLGRWREAYPQFSIIGGVDFAQFGTPQLVPPIIIAEQDLFVDSLLVELTTKANKASIKFTTDGNTPTPDSPTYAGPFYVSTTTELRAILTMAGWKDSEPATRTFVKSGYKIARLRANLRPHENYKAQGIATLSDLKKGSSSFGDGQWLGYLGTDLSLTADLGKVEEISTVTIGTLVDQGSYIHLPRSIKVSTSKDGKQYIHFQTKQVPAASGPTETMVHNHLIQAATAPARYLRIEITGQKVNPAWHPAPGEPCWLFLDEVLVE